MRKEELMIQELRDIEKSPPFLEWLYALGFPRDEVITKEMFIEGYCEDLAIYLSYKYRVQVKGVDCCDLHVNGHWFVELDGRYYDALNPEGVVIPSELEWSKQAMVSNPAIKPEQIDNKLQDLDLIWNRYKTLSPCIVPCPES